MNTLWSKSLLMTVAVFGMAMSARAQASYDLRSPDKRIEVQIRTAQGIRYDVVLNGRGILQDSSLSLDVDHKVLGREVKVAGSKGWLSVTPGLICALAPPIRSTAIAPAVSPSRQ